MVITTHNLKLDKKFSDNETVNMPLTDKARGVHVEVCLVAL